jgi:hypothetical protein
MSGGVFLAILVTLGAFAIVAAGRSIKNEPMDHFLE